VSPVKTDWVQRVSTAKSVKMEQAQHCGGMETQLVVFTVLVRAEKEQSKSVSLTHVIFYLNELAVNLMVHIS